MPLLRQRWGIQSLNTVVGEMFEWITENTTLQENESKFYKYLNWAILETPQLNNFHSRLEQYRTTEHTIQWMKYILLYQSLRRKLYLAWFSLLGEHILGLLQVLEHFHLWKCLYSGHLDLQQTATKALYIIENIYSLVTLKNLSTNVLEQLII